MMAIARENNFSETAFTVREPDGSYRLRWFTPTSEVDLCGHATLATSYVLFNFYEHDATQSASTPPRTATSLWQARRPHTDGLPRL